MVLVNQEAQIAAPIRADSSHVGRRLPRDGSTCAMSVILVEGLSPFYRVGHEIGRILLTLPCPRAQPQARMIAPRAPRWYTSSQLGGVLCTYKVTFSGFCLEKFSVPSGPSFCANIRPIQPKLHPQAIGSQWDHSCSKNCVHTQVVPLAVARADSAVCFQPQSLQHLHVFHLP